MTPTQQIMELKIEISRLEGAIALKNETIESLRDGLREALVIAKEPIKEKK